MSVTKDPLAVVQAAIDLTQAAREADALIQEIDQGDKALGDRRLRLGRIFRDVRRQFPERGPKAKGWGDFLAARKMEQRTAHRYLALAEHYEHNPGEERPVSEVYATFCGKVSDTVSETYPALAAAAPGPQLFAAQQALAPAEKAPPKAQPQSLPAANLPPSTNAVDRWQRFLKGELTGPEALDRKRNWTEAHQESDARIRQEYSAACKAARAAGKTVPPFPPMPGYWLTAGASNDPVQAAAKALSAAEALGREDASRKSPRMIGEVVQRLRQASHLIPSGQDQAVYRAYCEARTAAVSRAAVEDTKTMPLPFEAPPAPAPRPYSAPLFSDGPGAAILGKVDAEADDVKGWTARVTPDEAPRPLDYYRDYTIGDEDEDDFDPEDGDADLIADDDDREDEDELREAADMLEGERDRLATELTRVRAERDELRKERDELRDGWELAAREREAGAALRARLEATEARLERVEVERAAAKDELREVRAKLEAAEARLTERGQQLHQQRQDGAELLRRAEDAEAGRSQWAELHRKASTEVDALRRAVKLLREDAGEAGLVVCEHDDGEGGCDRICAPNPEGEALCPAHQAAQAAAAATPILRPKRKAAKAPAAPPAPRRDPASLTVADLPVVPGIRWEKQGKLWSAELVPLRQMSLLEAFAVGDLAVTGYGCCYRIEGTCGRSGLRVKDARPGMDRKDPGQINDLLVLAPGVARSVSKPVADPTLPVAIPIEDRFVVRVTEAQLSPILAKTLDDWGGDWGNQSRAIVELGRATLAAAMDAAAAAPQAAPPAAPSSAAPAWQPASVGGAKAVHALPNVRATPPPGLLDGEEIGHPAALCSQRPAYKSKGWTPRPGVALTCDACKAEAGLA